MITISLSQKCIQNAVFKAFSSNLKIDNEKYYVTDCQYKDQIGWCVVENGIAGSDPLASSHNNHMFDRSKLNSADPNDYISILKEEWKSCKRRLERTW